MTPMIDVTFLLIVFFILVTQFSNVQVAEEVQLPRPDEPASAQPDDQPRRLIVNVIPAAGSGIRDGSGIGSLRYGLREYPPSGEGIRSLATDLATDAGMRSVDGSRPGTVRLSDSIQVDFRADRSVAYGRLYPVLRSIMGVGFSHVNLVINVDVPERRRTESGA